MSRFKVEKIIRQRIKAIILILGLLTATAGVLPEAFATTYTTNASVVLTNMNTSGAGPAMIVFTPQNTGTTLSLTMAGGSVATTQTISNTYDGATCMSLSGASSYLPGTPTAAGATGTITISGLTAFTSGTSYCAWLTSATAITNPAGAGQETATLTAGTDSADALSVDIIANDQVVVNATVPTSFTLALAGSPDSLGTMSTGSIASSTGVTATVNTNAKTGWSLYGQDANGGLLASPISYTITSTSVGSNASLTAGTQGYLSGISSITQGTGAGTTTATAAYNSSGAGNGAGLNSSTWQKLASSTGTANGAVVTVKEFAAISAITPASTAYTDTITLVGAGSF